MFHVCRAQCDLLRCFILFFLRCDFPLPPSLLSTASLSPSVPYGRLEQFTELVVSPKIRNGLERLDSMKTSQERFGGRQNAARPSSSSSAAVGPSFFRSTSPVPRGHQWGGVADLRGLLRHMVGGEPARELPPVPDIPNLLADSAYRVCAAPPNSLCTISQVTSAVVHVFPLSHRPEAGLTAAAAGQCSVTYGLLSKVAAPKESRERLKLAAEKKKMKSSAATQTDGGEGDAVEVKGQESLVVRVVCHGVAGPAGSDGDIHSGRVWVSFQHGRHALMELLVLKEIGCYHRGYDSISVFRSLI